MRRFLLSGNLLEATEISSEYTRHFINDRIDSIMRRNRIGLVHMRSMFIRIVGGNRTIHASIFQDASILKLPELNRSFKHRRQTGATSITIAISICHGIVHIELEANIMQP